MLKRRRKTRSRRHKFPIEPGQILPSLFILVLCALIGVMGFSLLSQFSTGNITLARTLLNWGMPSINGEQEGHPGWEYTVRSLVYMVTDYDSTSPRSYLALIYPILSGLEKRNVTVSRSSIFVPELSFLPEPTRPTDSAEPLPIESSPVKQPTEIRDPRQPQVLIYHTHTSEMYLGPERASNSLRDSHYVFRSSLDDAITGVMEVGRHLAMRLSEQGITTLHETHIHDFPSLAYSYVNSETTVKDVLQKYPSIEVVVDLHRDAEVPDPVAMINNQPTARVLLVLGTAQDIPRPHPHWEQNLAFAKEFYRIADQMYPGLMRPMQVRRDARYNQHLHPSSILIEIGSVENSLTQALAAADLVAEILAKML